MSEKWTKAQIETAKKYLEKGCDDVGCKECVLYKDKGNNSCLLNYPLLRITLPIYEKRIKSLIQKHEHDADEPEDISISSPRDTISAVCDAMKSLLLYKNEKYGNSALEPVGIFFQNKPEESDSAGILIRLDDKLGRIKNRDKLRVNDLSDMIGYLTLLLASMSGKEDVIAEMNKQKD